MLSDICGRLSPRQVRDQRIVWQQYEDRWATDCLNKHRLLHKHTVTIIIINTVTLISQLRLILPTNINI